MTRLLLSIITINLNNYRGLARTLTSVREQTVTGFEYIVVDGGSTDGSRELITQNEDMITQFVSEPDRGLYDAMNKGLAVARGEFVIMMNSGDSFFDAGVLAALQPSLTPDVDVVYSDACIVTKTEQVFKCDFSRLRLIHQCVVYRRSLHDAYGKYLVGKSVTIADYIFFNQIREARIAKLNRIIARYDATAGTSHLDQFYQKICVDYIFGNHGKFVTAALLVAHPIYYRLKRALKKVWS